MRFTHKTIARRETETAGVWRTEIATVRHTATNDPGAIHMVGLETQGTNKSPQ